MKASIDELNNALMVTSRADLQSALDQSQNSGLVSLVGKVTTFLAAKPGSDTYAAAVDPLKWQNLTPEERQAAINIGASFIPYGKLTGFLTRLAPAGLSTIVTKGLGLATEGGAIGASTQMAGNLANSEPLTKDVGRATLTGAGANLALGGAGSQLPRLSADARALMERGIVPTVGQAMDKGTLGGQILGRTEEKIGSLPLVGDVTRYARERAGNEWRYGAIEQARPPTAPPLTGNTQEQLGQLQDTFKQRYGEAAAQSQLNINDRAFGDWYRQFQNSIDDPNKIISQENRDKLRTVFDNQIQANIRYDANGNGYLPGEYLKRLDSTLGKMQQQYFQRGGGEQPNLDAFDMGSVARETKQGLREAISTASPAAATIYNEINPLYARYKPIEEAALRASGQQGEFTPNQLLNAIKSGENPATFARGGRPGSLQEYAQQGQNVLANRLGNSGTADRTLPWLMAGTVYSPLLVAGALGTIGSGRLAQRGLLGLINAGEQVGPYAQRLTTAMSPQLTGDNWSLLGQ